MQSQFKLSVNKALFKAKAEDMEDNISTKPECMSSIDANNVIKHYLFKEKENPIFIYKNGETLFGQALLEQEKKTLMEIPNQDLAYLKNKATKYIYYVFHHLFEQSRLYHAVKANEFKDFLNIFKKYNIQCPGMHFSGLSLEKDVKILDIFKGINEQVKLTINAELQKKSTALNPLIEIYKRRILEYQEEIAAHSITGDNIQKEIRHIQQMLKPGKAVGYLYTNGSNGREKGIHFEVLIITPERFIKPLSWYAIDKSRPQATINANDPHTAYFALDKIIEDGDIPVFQGSDHGCGTFCFLNVKEYLKENAAQLKHYTLQFPFYTKEGKLQWFFYPSPHVLRYGESSFFNKIVKTILTDSDDAITLERKIGIQSKTTSTKVQTIQCLLKESIKKASENGDIVTAEYNYKILENLESFRKKWMDEYEKAMQKREAMQPKNRPYNLYLTYSSHRMKKIAEKEVTSQSKKDISSPFF